MNQVPSIIGLNYIGEGGHRRSIHARHEDLVDILVGAAALEARAVSARGKVVRTNRIVLAVGQGRGRRPVTLTVGAVTLPAFELREQRLAMGNAFDSDRGLRRNCDRRACLFLVPAWREYLDVGDQDS